MAGSGMSQTHWERSGTRRCAAPAVFGGPWHRVCMPCPLLGCARAGAIPGPPRNQPGLTLPNSHRYTAGPAVRHGLHRQHPVRGKSCTAAAGGCCGWHRRCCARPAIPRGRFSRSRGSRRWPWPAAPLMSRTPAGSAPAAASAPRRHRHTGWRPAPYGR